jgi:nitric oxide reductase large subunit
MQGKELIQPSIDPVSDILKWILLIVAITCFAILNWATVLTYEKAPSQPQAFTVSSGNVIMSAGDIAARKGGFQKADLMDYGRNGLMEEGVFLGHMNSFRQVFNAPGLRAAWKLTRMSYDPDFAQFVDRTAAEPVRDSTASVQQWLLAVNEEIRMIRDGELPPES